MKIYPERSLKRRRIDDARDVSGRCYCGSWNVRVWGDVLLEHMVMMIAMWTLDAYEFLR